MSREVVVVHERFVAAQPVTLELKNTSWIRSALTPREVAVTDATTHTPYFEVKEKLWSFSDKHTILDERGHEIAVVRSGLSMTRRDARVSGEGFNFVVRYKSSVAVISGC
jgi:hypothetical protein